MGFFDYATSNNYLNTPVQSGQAGFIGPQQYKVPYGGSSIPVEQYAVGGNKASGSILGQADYKPPASTGGGNGGGNPTPTPTGDPKPSGPSDYEQYLNSLYSTLGSAYNKMEGDLTPMYDRRAQGINDIFNSANQGIDLQGQQGQNTINSQRQGVETNQVRSLKDLSNAITQSYGSFSNQLGNMGAGDSSASRVMLPYALSRTEAQQRGQLNRTTADQMSKINESEAKLKSDVMIEKNKLEQGKIGEMASLGEWFDNAKMQISQMRLGDAKAAGAQVMELALKKLQGIEDTYNNKKTALESWALSNSSNLAQLKQNMSATTDPSLLGANPTYDLSGINNNNITTSASQAPVGYGGYNSIEDTFKKLGLG